MVIMTLPRRIVLFAYTFFFISLSSSAFETKEFYPHEHGALIQLRDFVSSAVNLSANWTGPPCFYNQSRWYGVNCHDGHVVHLVLENVQLGGSLPRSFLHNLTFLSKLNLRNNLISGPLPNLTNHVHLADVLLSHNDFTGYIPIDYIILPSLKVLHLQENFLNGEIPPFDQPSLVSFNVSHNHLRGRIPTTLVLQRFPKSSYEHNSGLCGSPLGLLCTIPHAPPPDRVKSQAPVPMRHPRQERKRRDLEVWAITLIAIAAALVFLALLFIWFCCHKRKHGKGAIAEETLPDLEEKALRSKSMDRTEKSVELTFFRKDLSVFDLEDLLGASAQKLGNGNLGATFKAMLEFGAVYAVKRLDVTTKLREKEFVQQMQVLGQIKHENLVEIIAYHCSKEQKLVIYEFVTNGSLFELLHERRGIARASLEWTTRLAIIKDIAKGLIVLQESMSSHKVPHANLKSSNILIHQENQKFHAKLTDYGFLPLLHSHKAIEKLAIAKSPEFYEGKKLTHKADVYCFGIVLLEIITGKIPGEILKGSEEKMEDLSDWVREAVNEDWSTELLDVELLAAKDDHNEMLKLTKIALECTNQDPRKRPKMCEVLRRIEEIEEGSLN